MVWGHLQTSMLVCLLCSPALSGCLSDNESLANPSPLSFDEVGPLNITVTIDFGRFSNESLSLVPEHNYTNITFSPLFASNGTTAFRIMEAIQARENFSIEVTYYAGMGSEPSSGAFVHTIDGVGQHPPEYWIVYHNDKRAEVGIGALKLSQDSTLYWVLEEY